MPGKPREEWLPTTDADGTTQNECYNKLHGVNWTPYQPLIKNEQEKYLGRCEHLMADEEGNILDKQGNIIRKKGE